MTTDRLRALLHLAAALLLTGLATTSTSSSRGIVWHPSDVWPWSHAEVGGLAFVHLVLGASLLLVAVVVAAVQSLGDARVRVVTAVVVGWPWVLAAWVVTGLSAGLLGLDGGVVVFGQPRGPLSGWVEVLHWHLLAVALGTQLALAWWFSRLLGRRRDARAAHAPGTALPWTAWAHSRDSSSGG